MSKLMHEAAATFMDDVFVDGVDHFFSSLFGANDSCFRENFEVVGDRWLGKPDFLHDAVCIDFFVALYDVQNRMPVAVMDGSEECLPFFGTRAFHIEPHQYDITLLLILRMG